MKFVEFPVPHLLPWAEPLVREGSSGTHTVYIQTRRSLYSVRDFKCLILTENIKKYVRLAADVIEDDIDFWEADDCLHVGGTKKRVSDVIEGIRRHTVLYGTTTRLYDIRNGDLIESGKLETRGTNLTMIDDRRGVMNNYTLRKMMMLDWLSPTLSSYTDTIVIGMTLAGCRAFCSALRSVSEKKKEELLFEEIKTIGAPLIRVTSHEGCIVGMHSWGPASNLLAVVVWKEDYQYRIYMVNPRTLAYTFICEDTGHSVRPSYFPTFVCGIPALAKIDRQGRFLIMK